eukprot:CAMPEP_0116882900 /NCGR_PEP_ID=MMETSP0463-20121206/15298_1 /TAXON_ID=181622 /ORGANISM="Strombidinopsis sp, Strain SopsisLIS2011" /LENGTH=129 /DNA_ID=CAMNT_0004536879 /DNA_START=1675 /DNA_END=2064 /DNA_ORIENTATION=-
MILLDIPDPFGAPWNTDSYVQSRLYSLEELRPDEYKVYDETVIDGPTFLVAYSTLEYAGIEAIIGICRTLFVCLVLSVCAIYFQQDANNLVLIPIERMLEKVRLIAKNPLVAATDEVEKAGIMTTMGEK